MLKISNAVWDGEIICVDDAGVSVFNQPVFRRGVQYFYGFDLVWLDGKDLRALPLLERKEQLREGVGCTSVFLFLRLSSIRVTPFELGIEIADRGG